MVILGKCPLCGHVVASDARRCVNCGAREFFWIREQEADPGTCETCSGRGHVEVKGFYPGGTEICGACSGKGLRPQLLLQKIDLRTGLVLAEELIYAEQRGH